MDVWIRVPEIDGPVPLVVFAHGIPGHPRSHTMLLDAWAEAGFVVAAPVFPLTNKDYPGAAANVFDIEGQFGDASFIVDALTTDPEFSSAVDADAVAMAGHSLGGLTTAGATLIATADRRFDAAIVMSAGFIASPDAAGLPTMVVHGDADTTVPYSFGTAGFETLTGPRWMVGLVGGSHITGILDDDSQTGVVLRGATVAFFDAHLRDGDPSTLEAILDEAVAAGIVAPMG